MGHNRGMLRLVLPITLVATLAGCVVVPPQAWSYDPTRSQARPAPDAAQAAQVAPLTNRIAQLQTQLNEVRARIAVQPDAQHRLPLYSQEHGIGSELSPLQRQLGQYAQAR
jgi:hypothetical protein